MSTRIQEELMLLAVSAYGGIILIICYDAIRIFRRVFPASHIRVIVEDIVFWTIASIYVFNIFLDYNFGRPRFFAVIATLIVMFLYEWFVGKHIVGYMASVLRKVLKTLFKPLKKILKMFRITLRVWIKLIRKRVRVWLHTAAQEEIPQEQAKGRRKGRTGRQIKWQLRGQAKERAKERLRGQAKEQTKGQLRARQRD